MALYVLVSGLAALSRSRCPLAISRSRCRAPQLCADPERVAEPQISVLDEWEELPDGRFTGRLSQAGVGAEAGAEVWITPRPGSRDAGFSGAVVRTQQITSAGGRPYLLGAPRTEAVEDELAGLDALVAPLQIYKKSAVVGKYIEENAPPAVRTAMRERDSGFLRVAVGVAVLAYAAGLYVGSQPMDGRGMAPGEQPVLAPWHGRSTATVTAGAPSAAGERALPPQPLTLQGAKTLQGSVGEQRLRQEVVVDRDRLQLRELEASGVPTPMGLLPRDEPTALRLERLRSELRSSQEALDEVRRVEAERGAGAPAVPAVQGALGVFPKTRAVLDTFKGSLDTF